MAQSFQVRIKNQEKAEKPCKCSHAFYVPQESVTLPSDTLKGSCTAAWEGESADGNLGPYFKKCATYCNSLQGSILLVLEQNLPIPLVLLLFAKCLRLKVSPLVVTLPTGDVDIRNCIVLH